MGFKSFSTINSHIVIPYFTDIFWPVGYTDVNVAIDDIFVAFVKDGSMNTYCEIIIWLRQNIRSIHGIDLFITCVSLSMICLYLADGVKEFIS